MNQKGDLETYKVTPQDVEAIKDVGQGCLGRMHEAFFEDIMSPALDTYEQMQAQGKSAEWFTAEMAKKGWVGVSYPGFPCQKTEEARCHAVRAIHCLFDGCIGFHETVKDLKKIFFRQWPYD